MEEGNKIEYVTSHGDKSNTEKQRRVVVMGNVN